MSKTHTHTVATMAIPAAMHRAILRRLQEADYIHAIGDDGLLDMSGIGLEACPATNAWWGRGSDWHPATVEGCLEQMEDMREDWSELAKLLGFDTFTDPEEIFRAVRALIAWPPQAIIDGEELRRAVGVVGVVGNLDGHDVVRRESVLDVIDRRIPAVIDGQLPTPKTPEQRRWFVAGAHAAATGRAFVNAGDSEQQFIAAAGQDAPAAWLKEQATRVGECLDAVRLNLRSILASCRHVPTEADGHVLLENVRQEVGHAQQLLQAVSDAVGNMLVGTAVAPGSDLFAPEYFTHDGAGLVHFTRVPPAHWPEWAAEAFKRMGGGQSLYDDLLAILDAKDHASARASIGGLRGRVVSLQSQLADAMRRVVDAQRLAWALVDAAGGCVELPPAVIATTDWSGKNLQQLVVPGGGVRFTSTQDTRR